MIQVAIVLGAALVCGMITKAKSWILAIIGIIMFALLLKWQALIILSLAVLVAATSKLQKNQFTAIILASLLIIPFGFMRIGDSFTLHVGYSVFAFSAIAQIIETYKSRLSPSFSESLAYLLYFPKMMAGPIIKPEPFIRQLRNCNATTLTRYKGIKLLIIGAFIKYLIIGSGMDENIELGLNQILGIFRFGLAFYLDFFSYCLMAMGLSELIGIHLPLNFNAPYRAKSFKDFWKRWNITLSEWLKDYVYIPLGGNRKGKIRQYLNILIVFTVSAIWHGLSLPFMLWGWIHAILVVLEKSIIKFVQGGRLRAYLYGIIVSCIAIILWQCFISPDITSLFNRFEVIGTPAAIDWTVLINTLFLLIVVFTIDIPVVSKRIYNIAQSKSGIIVEGSCLAIMLALTLLCPNQLTFNFFYLRF